METVADSLIDCLTTQPWHALRALAQANGCPFHGRWNKAAAVAVLVAALGAPARLPVCYARLDADARAALRALLEADGILPYADFTHRFGLLPPYRPWRAGEPPAPWAAPVSPAQTLFYQGLVFPGDLGDRRHPRPVIILPREFHAPLAALLEPAPLAAVAAPPRVSAPPYALPLARFLSFLERETLAPLHGRWLPPQALRALAAFLPAAPPALRSELQWPYLTFLHYLAEQAGLIAVNAGLLKPTTEAYTWLDAAPAVQLSHLWQAWRAPTAENARLWQRYRLPLAAEAHPPHRFADFCQALAARPPYQASPVAYLDVLEDHAPALCRPESAYRVWAETDPEAQVAYHAELRAAFTALLTGPLAWLGLLETTSDGLNLTPWGAAFLALPGSAWPPPPPPLALQLTPVDADTFALHYTAAAAGSVTPRLRLQLETLAPPTPAALDTGQLTRASVHQALQQGATAESLLTLLEHAADPLPPLLVAALYRWAAELETVSIRQIILLETRDPALLQTLTRARRVRETLGETLSARAVRVNAARLPDLLRRLARRGITPRLEISAEAPAPPAALAPADQGPADQVEIAAALRVYCQLIGSLNAPVAAPYTLQHTWEAQLTLAQRDAAAQRAQALLQALRQAAPPPTDEHLPAPTGPILAQLEQAIAAQQPVTFTYYTAGRADVTRRRVDPLRLEWHGEVAYLIGYCHLRQAQRVFRVDRIQELAPAA